MALKPIDWEQKYETWGEVLKAYSPSRLLDVFRTWVPPQPGFRTLELGCAPGRWLRWYENELGAECHGIDLNEPGLRLTQAVSPTIAVAKASAYALPYRNGFFDLVFSIGLLEHFEDPVPLIRESLRVLKPGGLGIAITPNIAPGAFQGWHWRTFDPTNYEGHRTFTLDELERDVRLGGYDIVHREYNGLYIPKAQRAIMKLGLGPVARLFEVPPLATSLVIVGRRPGGAVR